jgi:hypothetical protein
MVKITWQRTGCFFFFILPIPPHSSSALLGRLHFSGNAHFICFLLYLWFVFSFSSLSFLHVHVRWAVVCSFASSSIISRQPIDTVSPPFVSCLYTLADRVIKLVGWLSVRYHLYFIPFLNSSIALSTILRMHRPREATGEDLQSTLYALSQDTRHSMAWHSIGYRSGRAKATAIDSLETRHERIISRLS